jgi:beta-1,4-mannosyl-glycoprotein beta-1,4-N-acetylglucosaminyltransferase
MIYDCFTFFNELDILELRLELLYRVVDKFVIIESPKTHSFDDKALYYLNNLKRFEKYSDKIIHVVVSDFPPIKNSWTLENFQRNQILTVLKDCDQDDLILISDVDEIPNPKIITSYPFKDKIYCLVQDQYFFYFNYRDVKHLFWIGGTKVFKYSTILNKNLNESKVHYNDISFPQYMNTGITATKIRLYDGCKFIYNGGWHFTYLGGVDSIIKKIKSFSHQELNNEEFLNRNRIEGCLKTGKDVFGRSGHRFVTVRVDITSHPIILTEMPFLKKHLFNSSDYRDISRINYYSQLFLIKLKRFIKLFI